MQTNRVFGLRVMNALKNCWRSYATCGGNNKAPPVTPCGVTGVTPPKKSSGCGKPPTAPAKEDCFLPPSCPSKPPCGCGLGDEKSKSPCGGVKKWTIAKQLTGGPLPLETCTGCPSTSTSLTQGNHLVKFIFNKTWRF